MDRITGRVSADGTAYELVQGDKVLRSTPIEEARADPKHSAAIRRNKWGEIKDYIWIEPTPVEDDEDDDQ